MFTVWKLCHPKATHEMLGHLVYYISEDNPKSAKEQLDQNYRHGGGWIPFVGHRFDPIKLTLTYPGDPPMQAIGETQLRDERIILFESAWVAIVQKDGSHQIARMD